MTKETAEEEVEEGEKKKRKVFHATSLHITTDGHTEGNLILIHPPGSQAKTWASKNSKLVQTFWNVYVLISIH